MDILFVDDERGLLDQAKIFLEKINDQIEVDPVISAEKGLEKLDENEYDGIISDYQMPEIDGLEFLKRIRNDRGMDIPFIMFTGKGREEVAMEALNLGADRYLQKGGDAKSQYGLLADAVHQEVSLYHGEKAQKRLSSIVQSSNDAIIGKNIDGMITSWNKGAEEIYGYAEEEVLGEHISIIVPEDKKSEIDDILSDIKEGKRVEPFETRRVKKDGEEIYISLTVSPIFDKNDNVIGASAIAQNITNKKYLEKELERSEKRFRKAIEEAPYPAMIHAEDGEVISINKVWTKITGYKKEDIPTVDEWLHKAYGKEAEEIKTDLEVLYDIPERKSEGIYCVSTKDGEKRYWDFNSSNIGELEDGRSLILSMADDITERKDYEKKLKESEENLRNSQIISKVGAWKIDLENNELTWSDETYRIFGIPIGEPVDYDDFLGFIHPKDKKFVDEKWDEGLKTGEYDIEHRILVDGETKWVREKANIQYDENKKPVDVIGSVQDITEVKKKEEELKESEERYRTLFEDNPEAIVEVDEDFKIIKVNSQFEKLFKYKEEEIKGEQVNELIVPKGKKEKADELNKRSSQKGYFKYETVRMDKKGKEVPVSITGRPIKYSDKTHHLAVYKDISDLKDVKKDLDEMEERKKHLVEGIKRYRNLIEASPDTILLIDTDSGEIIDANQRAEDLFKMPREKVIGKNISDFKTENEEDLYKKVFRQWKIGSMDTGKHELHILDDEGNVVPVEIGTSSLELGGKKVIFGVLRDISKRKEAEERQEFLHSLLRHDVRNKTSIVKGYLQLINEDDLNLPENVSNYLSMAEDSAGESIEIINKVNSLRKAQEEDVKKVNINTIVKEVLKHTSDIASERGIEISLNISEDDQEVIGGSLLDQVFTNIIENAIQHSDCNRINISSRCAKDEIIYTIEDDGKGISKEEKKKIFKKGYTTDEERGTGLGMFLVKKLLEIYGGDIEVKDSEMGGCRFDVFLKRM